MWERVFYKAHLGMGWLWAIDLSGVENIVEVDMWTCGENKSPSFSGMFHSGIFSPVGSSPHASCFKFVILARDRNNSPINEIISRNNGLSDRLLTMKNLSFSVKFQYFLT